MSGHGCEDVFITCCVVLSHSRVRVLVFRILSSDELQITPASPSYTSTSPARLDRGTLQLRWFQGYQ